MPSLQPLRDNIISLRQGRTHGPSWPLLSSLPSRPLQTPWGEGSSAFGGSFFPTRSPTPKSLAPEGHFNSLGRRVHLLLNAGLASRSPDGCGAHWRTPLRAEPPPSPGARRSLRHCAPSRPRSIAIRNLLPAPAAECGEAGVTFGRIAVVAQETVVDFAGINVLLH